MHEFVSFQPLENVKETDGYSWESCTFLYNRQGDRRVLNEEIVFNLNDESPIICQIYRAIVCKLYPSANW